MIKIFKCSWQRFWFKAAARPRYRAINKLDTLAAKMIYVENGHFLYNIIGDPEFTWKHKRVLFISVYKNKKMKNNKYHISSVFSINDIKDYILSYLDIRYDKRSRKSLSDKQKYLQCMKKLKHDVEKYDICIDNIHADLLDLMVPSVTNCDQN